MAEARLVFDKPTEEQLKHIYKAEEELSLAGGTFDKGSDVDEGKILRREWELDWNLKGALVE